MIDTLTNQEILHFVQNDNESKGELLVVSFLRQVGPIRQ